MLGHTDSQREPPSVPTPKPRPKAKSRRRPATSKPAASTPGKPRVLRRERRNLDVELAPDEIRERSLELAVTHRQLRELGAEAEEWKKHHKSRLAEVESRQARLANEVETGRTYRDVFVEVRAHDDTREAVTIRTDTGVVISTRPLAADEMPRLFDEDPELPLSMRGAWDLGASAKGTERDNPYGAEDERYAPLRNAWEAGRSGRPTPGEPDPFAWGLEVGAAERKKANKDRDPMACPWPNAESIEAQRFEAGRAKKDDPHPPELENVPF